MYLIFEVKSFISNIVSIETFYAFYEKQCFFYKILTKNKTITVI